MTEKMAILGNMVKTYNELAYTHEYIFGYVVDGCVYMTITDAHMLPFVCCIDKASHGAGYALRYKPNMTQKHMLMAEGCTYLCTEKYLEDEFKATKYNRGEVFERLVTEYFGQPWEKDNVPFTEDGDLTVNGIAYQIKYQKATFINEKGIENLRK